MERAEPIRISELDGVRGIAILLVLVWHTCTRIDAAPATIFAYFTRLNLLSWSGVDLFFVLSGFLIGGGLIDHRNSPEYFFPFYVRRACRILPLYVVMLAIIGTLATIGFVEPGTQFISLPYYLTFTQNFWMAQHGWWLSFGQTWSLAVEEQFYLTLPLLIRLVPLRYLGMAIITLAALGPLSRVTIAFLFTEPPVAAHVLLPCRVDALLFGVLAAIVMRTPAVRNSIYMRNACIYAAFLALAVSTCLLVVKGYTIGTLPMMTFGYSAVALFYTTFLLLSLRTGPIQWLCRLTFLRVLGTRAYAIYLIHGIVPDLALRAVGRGPRLYDAIGWMTFGISIVAVFFLSDLSWRHFEARIIALGHRFSYGTFQVAAAA